MFIFCETADTISNRKSLLINNKDGNAMKTIHFLIPKDSNDPDWGFFHEFLAKELFYFSIWTISGKDSMIHTSAESFYPDQKGLQLHSFTVYDVELEAFSEDKVYVIAGKEEGKYAWGAYKLRSYKQVA